jgi:hypothetical protein
VAALVAIDRAAAAERLSLRLSWGALLLPLGAAILATASRGAVLALLLSSLTLMKRPKRLLWLGAFALILLAVVPNPLRRRLIEARDPFSWSHPQLWGTAVRIWTDHPWLGCGPGLYQACGRRHNFPVEASVARYGKTPNQAHNLVLQVLAEQGLLGVGLWLAALLLLLRPAARRGPAGAGLILLLLQAMVSNNLENRALAVLFLYLARVGSTRDYLETLRAARLRPRAALLAAGAAAVYAIAWVPYRAESLESQARQVARKHPQRATALVETSIRTVPIDPSSRRLLAALEAYRFHAWPRRPEALGRALQALGGARCLSSSDPAILDDRIALWQLAARHGYRTREQIEAARLDLLTALRLDPYNALRRIALAELERRAGRPGAVLTQLRAAVGLEPRFLRARSELAALLRQRGELAAARAQESALARLLAERPSWQPRTDYESELIRPPSEAPPRH